MSLFDWFRAKPIATQATKDEDENFRSSFRQPDALLFDSLTDGRAGSGAVVNARTAMSVGALVAGIRCISEDTAGCDFNIYDNSTGKKQKVLNHPIYKLFRRQPNPRTTATQWRQGMNFGSILYGNAFAEIVRDGNMAVKELSWIDPTTVQIQLDPDNQNLIYVIKPRPNTGEQQRVITYMNMFHLPSLTLDTMQGMSIIPLARETIGACIASQEFANAFFRNGLVPSFFLTHPEKLSDPAKQSLKEELRRLYQGFKKAYSIPVLDEGINVKQLSINPEDAMLVETMTYLTQEVARWLRIPSHKINENSRSTFSNIEALNTQYVQETIKPWLRRWENEIDIKLLSDDENLCADFDTTELLQGTYNDKASAQSTLFQIGAKDVDEVRATMGDVPMNGKGGDTHFVPIALTPIEQAIKPPAPPPAPVVAPKPDNKTEPIEKDKPNV